MSAKANSGKSGAKSLYQFLGPKADIPSQSPPISVKLWSATQIEFAPRDTIKTTSPADVVPVPQRFTPDRVGFQKDRCSPRSAILLYFWGSVSLHVLDITSELPALPRQYVGLHSNERPQ